MIKNFSLVGDHFLYPHDLTVGFGGDTVKKKLDSSH